MLLTAQKTRANNHSSLLPTCTESPILCHSSKSNNRSVVAISFRLQYHNNRPDISPSVNFTLARSTSCGRLFCAAFSNTDTVEPILPIFTPPWRSTGPLLPLSGSPAYLAGQQSPAFFSCGITSGSPQCRVSASMQGHERLSHIDAMHSRFDSLVCLRGYIHFSYLHTQSRLFG